MKIFTQITVLIICLISQSSFAKKGARSNEVPHREDLLSKESGMSSGKAHLKEMIQLNLMKEISVKETSITEVQVMNFLKETSKTDKNIQEFFSFIIKEGHRSDLKNIKDLFVNWILLNNTSFSKFESISAKQLSVIVKNLNQKDIVELTAVFELASNMMKVDSSLTPDLAYHKAMEEKGVNAEKIRKCKK